MKRLVCLVLMAVLAAGATLPAGEKLFPGEGAKVFAGVGNGDAAHLAVRTLVWKMGEYLGEKMTVLDVPGLAGAEAANAVAQLPNDGKSLLAIGSGSFGGFIGLGTAPGAMPWVWRGFYAFRGPAVLIVNPEKTGVGDIDAFLKGLRAGTVRVGINSPGSGNHVILEAFAKFSGLGKIPCTNYWSDRAVGAAVAAGQADAGMVTLFAVLDMVRDGKVKALFVNQGGPYRMPDGSTLPPVTAVFPKAAPLPGLCEAWGVFIRRDTPQVIVDKLEDAFHWAIGQPELKDFAARHGLGIVAFSGEDADRFSDSQLSAAAWALQDAGLNKNDPAKYDIPRPAVWQWTEEKKKYER